MNKYVFLNGKFVKYKSANISIEDRGFQFSDSVYEVIAIKKSYFVDLNPHLTRLKYSLNQLKINYSINFKKFKIILDKLLKKNNLSNGLIYIQISRGVQKRSHVYNNNLTPTLVIYTINTRFNNNIKKLQSVTAITHPDLRWKRRDIKTVSLLPNIMAAKIANNKSAFEAILIDDGYVTEATSSNIWVVKNNIIFTHPADFNILCGITRMNLKKIIKKNNLKFSEIKFKKIFLLNSDEVFLTSSSNFVTPITKIDSKIINNGKIGPITYKLARLYNNQYT